MHNYFAAIRITWNQCFEELFWGLARVREKAVFVGVDHLNADCYVPGPEYATLGDRTVTCKVQHPCSAVSRVSSKLQHGFCRLLLVPTTNCISFNTWKFTRSGAMIGRVYMSLLYVQHSNDSSHNDPAVCCSPRRSSYLKYWSKYTCLPVNTAV